MLNKAETIITVRTVHIDTINASQDLMMRVQMDKDAVNKYVEDMQAGSVFPDMECAELEGELLLYDGFLRYSSYKRCQTTAVQVRVRVADNHDDVVLWAVQANAHSDTKRTNADKQRSVEQLLNTEKYRNMTNVEVANAAGVVTSMVQRYRAKIPEDKTFKVLSSSQKASTRIDKAGRKRPRTYNKPKPKSAPPADTKSTYQALASVQGKKIEWPKLDHKPAQGYVHLYPPDEKRRQDNVITAREVIVAMRGIGEACKPLTRILAKITVDDFVATLNATEIQLSLRKLDQYRTDLEQMIVYMRELLERTRDQENK